MAETQLSADKEKGTITASTQNFELKSGVTESGEERDYVQGFLATTHTDKVNDRFTEEALKQMADDINKDNTKEVDAVFNDVDTEALREATTGNLDHNNNPAAPFGDTRTVPAFKVEKAEVRDTADGEKGLWIKAMLNTGGMLADTVSAVKNSIKDGFLNAFSVEFVPETVKQVRESGKVVRIIEAAKAKGAALTGRPTNSGAKMTGADLKSMAAEYKIEDEKDTMSDEEDIEDSEVEPEEDVQSESEEAEESENTEQPEQQEDETKSLTDDVQELKSTVQEVKDRNEQLEERNEELKSELEDLKTLQDIKSEVDEVKNILEDVELENGPRTETEQKRFDEEEQETKSAWKQNLDSMDEPQKWLEGQGKSKSRYEAFAENHEIDVQEVKNYVEN